MQDEREAREESGSYVFVCCCTFHPLWVGILTSNCALMPVSTSAGKWWRYCGIYNPIRDAY